MPLVIKFVAVSFAAVTALAIGIFIGKYAMAPDIPDWLRRMSQDGNPSISQRLMKEIKAENIDKNLQFFSRKSHIAGSPQDEDVLAKYIYDIWQADLDSARIYKYTVLLSYPNASDPNYVSILQEDGSEIDESAKIEKILRPEQDDPTVVNPFNCYSPAGVVAGDLVYVNYGQVEDFMYLARNVSLNLTGHVAIARYGRIYRGDKVLNAHAWGCAGIILYSDPADYVAGGGGRVYPEDWSLPGTGTQRGSIIKSNGDPLTPFYPAIDSAFFLEEKDADLPKIPVTPISYNDAVKYLSKMGGDEVPSSWRGNLNITYRFGPGFISPHNKSKIKLYVKTYNVKKPINNVIGYIRGEHEPDRYVVLGNHRDAWVFGAIDPSSGTAAMMEVSRAMGRLLKDGWRPRRSLIFCSWAAEEYNLIGATEWVEELSKILGTRAVAYLNVDMALEGNASFSAMASPILHTLLFEAAKKVENPNPLEAAAGRKTVYDTWLARIPSLHDVSLPEIVGPGSGSDYFPFLQLTGIPVLDMRYTFDQSYSLSIYPMYHSVYETYDLVSRLMDREFRFHQAVARMWGLMALTLADKVILKLDCLQYAYTLKRNAAMLEAAHGALLRRKNITLDGIINATMDFHIAAAALHRKIGSINIQKTLFVVSGDPSSVGECLFSCLAALKLSCPSKARAMEAEYIVLSLPEWTGSTVSASPLEVRKVNDQLMQLERAFIDPLGISGDPIDRHVIYAPNQHNSYVSSNFPGLASALFEIENDMQKTHSWEKVAKEISIIIFTIQSAASTLRDTNDIGGL